MGDFNHGHIQWESLESAGGDDHQFLLLTQDCFLTQHVLEPTRRGNVLDLILSSQNELVDNVKVHEPLGSSDHNQIHFNIKVKTGNTYKKQWRRNFNKGKYKDMRTYLAHIDWNNLLKNKTATECWTCLKYEIEDIISKFVPLRKQGKRSRKKHLSKEAIRNFSQHGFLKARSCLTNLLCFLEEITKCVDDGSPVDVVYLDFQKAFDKVPIKIMYNDEDV